MRQPAWYCCKELTAAKVVTQVIHPGREVQCLRHDGSATDGSYCIAAKYSFAEEDKKAPLSLGNA
jgi:hypothetical protein